VVPIRISQSAVDGTACVYLERAEYRPIGRGLVPLMREITHAAIAHRFYLDDGTGRILVDPSETLIDCATLTADGGLLAERRLRAGEEIELIAEFHADDRPPSDGDEGPYRAIATGLVPGPDSVGPPRISYRTEQGMDRVVLDDFSSFIRGAGALMIAISVLFGGVLALL
jgi:hypothetical protein